MPTAKKTKSGKWKVRVYSHVDADGKQHLRAFTADTKQEAERLAAAFGSSADRAARCDLTVREAILKYIDAKEGVLSPSTIRGYEGMLNNYFQLIGAKRIRRLKTVDVQVWVSDLAGKVSAKTVSNVYGLFTASVTFFSPDTTFRGIKLPQKKRRRVSAPSDEQVQELYTAAPHNLKKAIALEAFASMRRSEVCALTYGDIGEDGVAHVHCDMVRGRSGWIRKQIPKTSESDRFVRIPEQVLNLIGFGAPDERIVPITPDTVTELFGRLRDKLGYDIRYHDLRHYYASIAAVLKIPTRYVESFGGWRPGSGILRETYQNTIEPVADQYARQMSDHFDRIIAAKTSCRNNLPQV